MKDARGFTLTEILVALAVLTILVGSLSPVAVHQIGRARQARALKEIESLAESVQSFRYDVKAFPDRSGGAPNKLRYLLSAGEKPRRMSGWKGPRGYTADHLVRNAPPGGDYPESGFTSWRGPYLPNDPVDPWGRAYVISVAGMRGESGYRGWILSSGPNGILETDDGDEAIAAGSDDLGWRLR